jgi:predicted transport protein
MFDNLTLNDPKKIARDVSNMGHWGNGDYEIKIKL